MKPALGRTNSDRTPLAAAIARASFEHALDPMLLTDDERRCTGANPAACSLLGLDHETLLSRRLDDIVPVEAQAALDASWPDFLKRGYQRAELEVVVADGSRRTMEARSTARVLPGCHLSVLRDITDRAAAETARRTGDAYDFLTHVLAHVDEGLHVIDEQRRICFVNPVGAAMLGYETSELVTLPVHETIHHKHPDGSHFPADECPHLAVFDTGQSIRGEDCFVRKDGSMLAVAYSAAPIPLPDGRGAVVAFRDISDHARLQLEREHEREFLDAVLESLDTGVVACGPDGDLSLFNGAMREMHGLAPGPLRAADWAGHHDLFLLDGLTAIGAEEVPLSRALRGERLRDVELVVAAKHGSPPRTGLPVVTEQERTLSAIIGGRTIALAVVAVDVTGSAVIRLRWECGRLTRRCSLIDRGVCRRAGGRSAARS